MNIIDITEEQVEDMENFLQEVVDKMELPEEFDVQINEVGDCVPGIEISIELDGKCEFFTMIPDFDGELEIIHENMRGEDPFVDSDDFGKGSSSVAAKKFKGFIDTQMKAVV